MATWGGAQHLASAAGGAAIGGSQPSRASARTEEDGRPRRAFRPASGRSVAERASFATGFTEASGVTAGASSSGSHAATSFSRQLSHGRSGASSPQELDSLTALCAQAGTKTLQGQPEQLVLFGRTSPEAIPISAPLRASGGGTMHRREDLDLEGADKPAGALGRSLGRRTGDASAVSGGWIQGGSAGGSAPKDSAKLAVAGQMCTKTRVFRERMEQANVSDGAPTGFDRPQSRSGGLSRRGEALMCKDLSSPGSTRSRGGFGGSVGSADYAGAAAGEATSTRAQAKALLERMAQPETLEGVPRGACESACGPALESEQRRCGAGSHGSRDPPPSGALDATTVGSKLSSAEEFAKVVTDDFDFEEPRPGSAASSASTGCWSDTECS